MQLLYEFRCMSNVTLLVQSGRPNQPLRHMANREIARKKNITKDKRGKNIITISRCQLPLNLALVQLFFASACPSHTHMTVTVSFTRFKSHIFLYLTSVEQYKIVTTGHK